MAKQEKILIEQSAKKFKVLRGLGILVLGLSMVVGFTMTDSYGTAEGWPTILTVVGCVIGGLLYGVGTLLTWWEHG